MIDFLKGAVFDSGQAIFCSVLKLVHRLCYVTCRHLPVIDDCLVVCLANLFFLVQGSKNLISVR